MKRFLLAFLVTLALLAQRSFSVVGADHKCGEVCNQWTTQGACTHGCYAGGQANPDYHNPDDYKYNGPPQEEIDRQNREAAAAAKAVADAQAAADKDALKNAQEKAALELKNQQDLEAQKIKAQETRAIDQAAEAAKQPITINIEGRCDGWASPGSEHRNAGNGCFYVCAGGSWTGPNRCDNQGNGLFQGDPSNLSPEEIAKAVNQRQSEAYLTVLKQDAKTTAEVAAETANQRTAEKDVQSLIAIKEYDTKVAAANRETNVEIRNQMLAEYALLYQNSVSAAATNLSDLDSTVVAQVKAKLEKEGGNPIGTTNSGGDKSLDYFAIYCGGCGGFAADPKGQGCNAEIHKKIADRTCFDGNNNLVTNIAQSGIGAICKNPDQSLCAEKGGIAQYGTKKEGGVDYSYVSGSGWLSATEIVNSGLNDEKICVTRLGQYACNRIKNFQDTSIDAVNRVFEGVSSSQTIGMANGGLTVDGVPLNDWITNQAKINNLALSASDVSLLTNQAGNIATQVYSFQEVTKGSKYKDYVNCAKDTSESERCNEIGHEFFKDTNYAKLSPENKRLILINLATGAASQNPSGQNSIFGYLGLTSSEISKANAQVNVNIAANDLANRDALIKQASLNLAFSPTNISPDDRQEKRDEILKGLIETEKKIAQTQSTNIKSDINSYLNCRTGNCDEKLIPLSNSGLSGDYLDSLKNQRNALLAQNAFQNYQDAIASPDYDNRRIGRNIKDDFRPDNNISSQIFDQIDTDTTLSRLLTPQIYASTLDRNTELIDYCKKNNICPSEVGFDPNTARDIYIVRDLLTAQITNSNLRSQIETQNIDLKGKTYYEDTLFIKNYSENFSNVVSGDNRGQSSQCISNNSLKNTTVTPTRSGTSTTSSYANCDYGCSNGACTNKDELPPKFQEYLVFATDPSTAYFQSQLQAETARLESLCGGSDCNETQRAYQNILLKTQSEGQFGVSNCLGQTSACLTKYDRQEWGAYHDLYQDLTSNNISAARSQSLLQDLSLGKVDPIAIVTQRDEMLKDPAYKLIYELDKKTFGFAGAAYTGNIQNLFEYKELVQEIDPFSLKNNLNIGQRIETIFGKTASAIDDAVPGDYGLLGGQNTALNTFMVFNNLLNFSQNLISNLVSKPNPAIVPSASQKLDTLNDSFSSNALMGGAIPAAYLVGAVALIALPAGLSLASTFTYLSTAFGIYGTTSSLPSTAYYCSYQPTFESTFDKGACRLASLSTGYMALTTLTGVLAGANPATILDDLATNSVKNAVKTQTAGAIDDAIVKTGLAKAANATLTPIERIIQASSTGTGLIGIPLFGSQALQSCGDLISGNPDANGWSCLSNAGMALASMGRITSVGLSLFKTPSSVLTPLGRLSAFAGEGGDIFDGASSCFGTAVFNAGQCFQGVADVLLDKGNVFSTTKINTRLGQTVQTTYQAALSRLETHQDLLAAIDEVANWRAHIQIALDSSRNILPNTPAARALIEIRKLFTDNSFNDPILVAKLLETRWLADLERDVHFTNDDSSLNIDSPEYFNALLASTIAFGRSANNPEIAQVINNDIVPKLMAFADANKKAGDTVTNPIERATFEKAAADTQSILDTSTERPHTGRTFTDTTVSPQKEAEIFLNTALSKIKSVFTRPTAATSVAPAAPTQTKENIGDQIKDWLVKVLPLNPKFIQPTEQAPIAPAAPATTIPVFASEMRLNVGPRAPYHLIRVFFDGNGTIVAVSQEKHGETSSLNAVFINGKLMEPDQAYLVKNRDEIMIAYDNKTEKFVVFGDEFIGENGVARAESKYIIGLYPPPTKSPIPAPNPQSNFRIGFADITGGVSPLFPPIAHILATNPQFISQINWYWNNLGLAASRSFDAVVNLFPRGPLANTTALTSINPFIVLYNPQKSQLDEPTKNMLSIVYENIDSNHSERMSEWKKEDGTALYDGHHAIYAGYRPINLEVALRNLQDPYAVFPAIEQALQNVDVQQNKIVIKTLAQVVTEKTRVPVVIIGKQTQGNNSWLIQSESGKTYGVVVGGLGRYGVMSARYEAVPNLTIAEAEAINNEVFAKTEDSANMPYRWDYKTGIVFLSSSRQPTIILNEDNIDDPKIIKTVIHEFGHFIEENVGTNLSAIPYKQTRSEVISSLYAIKLASIIAQNNPALAAQIAQSQVELYNYVLFGDILPTPITIIRANSQNALEFANPTFKSLTSFLDLYNAYKRSITKFPTAFLQSLQIGDTVRIEGKDYTVTADNLLPQNLFDNLANGVIIKVTKENGDVSYYKSDDGKIVPSTQFPDEMGGGETAFNEKARQELIDMANKIRDSLNRIEENGDEDIGPFLVRLKNPESDPLKTGAELAEHIKNYLPKKSQQILDLIAQKNGSFKEPISPIKEIPPWQKPNSGNITDIGPILEYLISKPHVDLDIFSGIPSTQQSGTKNIPLINILDAPSITNWSHAERSGTGNKGFSITGRITDESLLKMVKDIRDGEFDLNSPRGENPISLIHLGNNIYLATEGTTRIMAAWAAGKTEVPAIVSESKKQPWLQTSDPKKAKLQYEQAQATLDLLPKPQSSTLPILLANFAGAINPATIPFIQSLSENWPAINTQIDILRGFNPQSLWNFVTQPLQNWQWPWVGTYEISGPGITPRQVKFNSLTGKVYDPDGTKITSLPTNTVLDNGTKTLILGEDGEWSKLQEGIGGGNNTVDSDAVTRAELTKITLELKEKIYRLGENGSKEMDPFLQQIKNVRFDPLEVAGRLAEDIKYYLPQSSRHILDFIAEKRRPAPAPMKNESAILNPETVQGENEEGAFYIVNINKAPYQNRQAKPLTIRREMASIINDNSNGFLGGWTKFFRKFLQPVYLSEGGVIVGPNIYSALRGTHGLAYFAATGGSYTTKNRVPEFTVDHATDYDVVVLTFRIENLPSGEQYYIPSSPEQLINIINIYKPDIVMQENKAKTPVYDLSGNFTNFLVEKSPLSQPLSPSLPIKNSNLTATSQIYLTNPNNTEYLLGQFTAYLKAQGRTDVTQAVQNLRQDLQTQGNTLEIWQKHISNLASFVVNAGSGVPIPPTTDLQSDIPIKPNLIQGILEKFNWQWPWVGTYEISGPNITPRKVHLNRLTGQITESNGTKITNVQPNTVLDDKKQPLIFQNGKWGELEEGTGGGGGGEGKPGSKILPLGAGIAAGFAAAASAVNLSDCNISDQEKGVMNVFDKIGLSKLTQMYMKNFDDRCIPPLEETYTCTDGKVYATNIHQPKNKIQVGECSSDSVCSDDGKYCVENPLQTTQIPTEAILYKDTIIELNKNGDYIKYLKTIEKVCDSLPEHFCRGAHIIVDNKTAFPYCSYGSYKDLDVLQNTEFPVDKVNISKCPIDYSEVGESILIHLLIHELSHRVQSRMLGTKYVYVNDTEAGIPTLDKTLPGLLTGFEYYMQWSYNRPEPGSGGSAFAEIFPEEKRSKAKKMMQDYFQSILANILPEYRDGYTDFEIRDRSADYYSSNSTENFSDFAAAYYADSLKFKGIFPELYRYYRDLVFQGREYKDGVWINK